MEKFTRLWPVGLTLPASVIGPTIVSAITSEVESAAHDDRPGIVGRRSECSSRLVPSAPVDLSSQQRRQAVELAAKSERGVRVVISHEFVGQISAEPERSAERENLKRTGGTVEGCSAVDVEEERCLRTDRHETGSLYVELADGVRQPGLCSTRDRVATTRVPRLGTDGLS